MRPNVNTATGQMLVQTMLENANGHMFFCGAAPPRASRGDKNNISCFVASLFSSVSTLLSIRSYIRGAREKTVCSPGSPDARARTEAHYFPRSSVRVKPLKKIAVAEPPPPEVEPKGGPCINQGGPSVNHPWVGVTSKRYAWCRRTANKPPVSHEEGCHGCWA